MWGIQKCKAHKASKFESKEKHRYVSSDSAQLERNEAKRNGDQCFFKPPGGGLGTSSRDQSVSQPHSVTTRHKKPTAVANVCRER
jgi:hypothetical protein